MLKVLIADDEPKIRRGLAGAIEWEKLNMEICGLAANGEQAVNLVEAERPDICIFDICMPIINGLDLIKAVKELNKDTICIVITGYDEFEYARESVKIGVFEYLLKPVNEMQLEDTLQRAKQVIEERKFETSQIEKAEKMLQHNIPFLRERFICELTSRVMSQQELEENAAFYGIRFEYGIGVLRIVLCEPEEYEEKDRKETELYQFILRNIVEEVLNEYATVYVTTDAFGRMIVLMDVKQIEYLEKAKEEIKNSVNTYMKLQVIVESEMAESLRKVYDIWEKWEEEGRKNLSRVVLCAKKYLEGKYSDGELSVKDIANACAVNSSYLSRVFKAEMGINLIDYLTKIRLQKALYYLGHTDMMIYEVAEKVGYKSQHYFCVAFKKVLGISPTEYRQKKA